jgi:hypothetical protein
MGRSERNAQFERFVALRARYASDETDRRAVLSIDDAIIYVEAVMSAAAVEVEPWTVDVEAWAPGAPGAEADADSTDRADDAGIAADGAGRLDPLIHPIDALWDEAARRRRRSARPTPTPFDRWQWPTQFLLGRADRHDHSEAD